MKLPRFSLRRKRKVGSPLKVDPILVSIVSRLKKINDYDSYRKWRKDFLERLGYFLVDEGVEKSEEAYHVRLRVKVDKLVRVVAKIAHDVNDGSLSPTLVTPQARKHLNDGMKCCKDISTYLKVLSPLTIVEEKIVGFTKYNTVAVLVKTGFKEYERLNMCKDILQVLREKFVNLVAEPQHLAAFDKFEKEMNSFKSVLLDDVGLLPVLKKQRQLKSPNPPKALIAEIRRGTLRESLISKSAEAKQAAQAKKNEQDGSDPDPTSGTTGKAGRLSKITRPSFDLGVFKRTKRASTGEIIDSERSKANTKERRSSALVSTPNRFENDHLDETKAKRMKRRSTTKSTRRRSKESGEEINGTNTSQSESNQRKGSKSLNRDSIASSSKVNRSSSRQRGVKNPASSETSNGDGRSRSDKKASSRNGATSLMKTSKSKSDNQLNFLRGEKGSGSTRSQSTKEGIIYGNVDSHRKSDVNIPVFSRDSNTAKGLLSEDERSTTSIHKKNEAKAKAKRAKKGRKSLRSAARERNTAMSNAVGSKEDGRGKPKGSTIQRRESRKKKKMGLSKSSKQKKNSGRSRSSSQKKNSSTTDDYKKIIHGKSYPLNTNWPLLVPASGDAFPHEASNSMQLYSIPPSLEQLPLKTGEQFNSNPLSSLLASSGSLDPEEDEMNMFEDKVPTNKEIDPSPSNMDYTSALSGFGNSQDEGMPVDFRQKDSFKGPSFYENHVKPLTMTENDSTGNNERDTLHEGKERWEGEIKSTRSIFEDSLRSSMHLSRCSSMAEALKNFNSEESIVELQRLNNVEKPNDGENKIHNSVTSDTISSPNVATRIEDGLIEGMAEAAGSRESRKVQIRRSEDGNTSSQFGEEHDFYESNEEYGMHHHTAEIVTAEEEAVRMEDEVSKLEIASADNSYHALDCTAVENDARKGNDLELLGAVEKLQMIENAHKLETSEDEVQANSNNLDHKEKVANEPTAEGTRKSIMEEKDEDSGMEEEIFELETGIDKLLIKSSSFDDEEEGAKLADEGTFLFREGRELENAEEIYKPEARQDDVKIYPSLHNEDEGVITSSDEEHSTFEEANELKMAEMILNLEADQDGGKKEVESSGRLVESRVEASGGSSSRDSKDTGINIDITFTEEAMERGVAFKYKTSSPKKEAEYPTKFSLNASEILSSSQQGKSSKGQELQMLKTLNQNRKSRMAHASGGEYNNESLFTRTNNRDRKAIFSDRNLRIYDPSARLSRWQPPQQIKRVV